MSRVVLYQSGIAYIEREGQVRGDELIIPVRPEQINDILASLIVIDRSHGGSVSVSLPVDRSNATNIYDLPPELREAGGLVAVLHALRGADVVVRHEDGTARGRVIGVEMLEGEPFVSVVADQDRIIPIRVGGIDDVRMENESVTMALDRALDQTATDGDWRPIDVSVHFNSDQNRDVTVAYVVEMPIWKPAYRIVIGDGGTLQLQGWAVVDNVSGQDWDDVELSLTAGTPISFRYDLHSPIYLQRPDMSGYGVPNVADLRPPTPINAQPTPEEQMMAYGALGSSGGSSSNTATGMQQGYGRNSAPSSDAYYDDGSLYDMDAEGGEESYNRPEDRAGWSDGNVTDSMGTSAGTSEIGSLVRYDIPGTVTVPDQSSTLVTIVNERVDGEDALVFQPMSGNGDHPYRTLLIDNTSEYPIQAAPIAIYADSTFVGEGITPEVSPGDSAFIPYALETRVRVDQRYASDTGEITLARIVSGQVFVETESLESYEFTATSGLGADETLYVQVARQTGYELLNEDPDIQTHSDYYLVPVVAEPGTTSSLTVRQSRISTQQMDIFSSQFPQVVAAYLSSPTARPDVAEQLRPIQEGLGDLAEFETQLQEQRELRGDIQAREGELRANIATLGISNTNSDLRNTLSERLAEQEELFDIVQARLVEIQESQSALRIQVTEQLRTITLQRDDADE